VNISKGYELNDLLLVPKPSTVFSREFVNLFNFCGGGLHLKLPIIASPMSGIVGLELIKGLGRLGGIGILHRFYNSNIPRAKDIMELEKSAVNYGVAVGLNDDWYMEAAVSGASIICIDVANGYLDTVVEFTNKVANYISSHNYNCLVMSGNVATYAGAKALADNGATFIRTGIGSGQLCTTRNNTGVGYPQASAIYDCSHEMFYNSVNARVITTEYSNYPWVQSKRPSNWKTVADGGIKNSGDAVKALALGANFVMLGSLFARCYESDNNGKIEGMASREFQEQFYGEVKKSVEGVQKEVEKNISLENFINEFVWNIKSGFTYCNSYNLTELHQNAEFILCGTESIVQK
jgi:IMP dehydrogenase